VLFAALLLVVGFAHGAVPHSHDTGDHGHGPAPCSICASGSAHFVAASAPTASLLPPPAAPVLVLSEVAPDCAAPDAPWSPRAPPSEVLS
jgi:hypothetical protein